MKLIIDIPEDMYNDANILIVKDLPELKKIIANGIPVPTEGDSISREALKKAIKDNGYSHYFEIFDIIDNAPTVEPEKGLIANVTFDEDKLREIVQTEVIDKINSGELVLKDERPQGKYVDISKLRLMTVEECA